MSVSVCLCVCACLSVREHILGTIRPIFDKFSCMLFMAVTRSSSSGAARCYVVPVLQMTSHLHIMDHGEMQIRLQRVMSLRRIAPPLPRIGCVGSSTTAGAKTRRVHFRRGAGPAVHYCLVIICRHRRFLYNDRINLHVPFTLSHDLHFPFLASYGHGPQVCKKSRTKVGRFKIQSVNRRTDGHDRIYYLAR